MIRWNAERFKSAASHREWVAKGSECWAMKAYGKCWDCAPVEVEYEGLVLRTGLSGGSFNDGYDYGIDALVWDPAKGAPRRVGYGSTMGMSGTAEVDATPEVLALYEAYEAREAEKLRISREIRDRKRIDIRGRKVRVVRGRKVPKGTEGEVFWSGPDRFNRHGVRVGLKTETGEKLFIDGHNLEAVDPEIEVLEARWHALNGSEEAAA